MADRPIFNKVRSVNYFTGIYYSLPTLYMEFINLIEIMNQTSIWIDKLSRLTSTRLRPA
jgi:hypothetical protein